MAQALQHDQATLVARLSATGTAGIKSVRHTSGTGRTDAINSLSRWFKISVRSIDGGIYVEVTKTKTLKRADWRAHLVGPDRRCLECLGQYDPGLVQADREGLLDDPEYIKGLPENHPARRNENVMAFSLNVGSFEVLQMLMMLIEPFGVSDPGPQHYHFVPGIMDVYKNDPCKPKCPYPQLIARGDRTGFTVTSMHLIAERARESRQAALPSTGASWFHKAIAALKSFRI